MENSLCTLSLLPAAVPFSISEVQKRGFYALLYETDDQFIMFLTKE